MTMTIIIPMAGLSSRFTAAGFTLPKYMLYVRNRSLFNLAVSSFELYFKTCDFLFIARDVFDTRGFIERECQLLGILNFKVVILEEPTRGQAETVALGIGQARLAASEPILIFNIDTIRPGFEFPSSIGQWDGYLEVFKGSGDNWSYARTESAESTRVVETAEKRAISDNCSTGIYYFRSVGLFMEAYSDKGETSPGGAKELYVAPLYNALIRKGRNIHIHSISREEVIFCGVPSEYYACLIQEITNGD